MLYDEPTSTCKSPTSEIVLSSTGIDPVDWGQIALGAWEAPSWREAAFEYHKDRPASRPENLARLRRLMSEDVLLERAWSELNDARKTGSTPKATIDAIMFAVRERGLAALREPATAQRLDHCDVAAKAEIERRIRNMKGLGDAEKSFEI